MTVLSNGEHVNDQSTGDQTNEPHESPVQTMVVGQRSRNPSIQLSLVTLQTSPEASFVYILPIFYADSFLTHLVGGLLINRTISFKIQIG